jgi:hypothetical protein
VLVGILEFLNENFESQDLANLEMTTNRRPPVIFFEIQTSEAAYLTAFHGTLEINGCHTAAAK